MAFYEHVFIARPDLAPAQVETALEEIKALIEEKGGKVGKTEYWGLRTLAYRMDKNRKGHYGLVDMEADASILEAIDVRQRFSDDVIRYLTIRLDELPEGPSAILRKGEERRRGPRAPRN
ncbi:30S ribosomal protein S6 [Woodsholea maritima]|uniref:30S ribosomal protein S6 n=1 Tax=Woodsholea maritima TaxID=240237 RepID=UPI0003805875|nr:30S ribosomal protein S6 [Woodsholea maritima]